MRRMIPQKDIDYINQLKGTIHNTSYNASAVTIGDPDNGLVLNGTDRWIVSERLAIGDPEGDYNGARIEINNAGQHGDITVYGPGGLVLDTEGNLVFSDNIYNIIFQGLRSSDPHVEGALWNDNGTLKISSGK